jgi:hypothetical protein
MVAACFATLCAIAAAGQPLRYSVTPLGSPRSDLYAVEGHALWPLEINNKGDIVGLSNHGPFLYRDSTVHLLEPGNVADIGYPTINDRGVILGSAWSFPGYEFISFLLPTSGRDPDLNLLDAVVLPLRRFTAWDINEHGAILGWVWENEDQSRPVIYQDGGLRELPGLLAATDINNRGQVLGDALVEGPTDGSGRIAPAIWSDGRLEQLGVLPGFVFSSAHSLNDRGEVVGHCADGEKACGFIYRGGVMTELPRPPGEASFAATDINNKGDVLISVSRYLEDPPGALHSQFWLCANGVLHDLNALVAAGWKRPVYNLFVYDMNDRGEIIATAYYRDASGELWEQAILLRPHR